MRPRQGWKSYIAQDCEHEKREGETLTLRLAIFHCWKKDVYQVTVNSRKQNRTYESGVSGIPLSNHPLLISFA